VLLEQFVTYPAEESLVNGGAWAVARVLEVIDQDGEALDGRTAVTLRLDVRPLDGARPLRTKLRTNVAPDSLPHAGDRYLARYQPGAPGSTALLRPCLPDAPDASVITIEAPAYDDFIQHVRRSERNARMLRPTARLLLVAGPALLVAWPFVPIGPWPGAVALLAAVALLGCLMAMPRVGRIGNVARLTYEKPRIDLFALVASGRPAVALILGTAGSVAPDGTPMVRLRVRLEPLDQDDTPADPVEAERLVAMRRLSVPRLGERFAALYDPDRPECYVLTSPTPLPPAAGPREPDGSAAGEPPVRISRSELLSRLDRLSEDRLTGELSEAEFARCKTELLDEVHYHL
jgi:hypothetical protein